MSEAAFREVLARFGGLSICVVGDLFLDRYFDIDAALDEPSVETGLTAYQVVRTRAYPGAGGNVANNLAALGVARVAALTVIGLDGEGYELKKCLDAAGIDRSLVIESEERSTPLYGKPMRREKGRAPRELNRIDIKNRGRLGRDVEKEVIDRLSAAMRTFDAFIIADQVSEADCGVITARVRRRLSQLAAAHPKKVFFADSRERISLFRNVVIKPNRMEAAAAFGGGLRRPGLTRIAQGAIEMSRRTGRAVYVTLGGEGCLAVHDGVASHIPTYAPTGPIDIVGAGDAFASAATAALAAGASCEEAGLTGNLAASITIEQIGVCGTADRRRLAARLREFTRQAAARL